jgi:hypothetical protein
MSDRSSRLKSLCVPVVVVLAVCAVVGWAAHSPVDWRTIRPMRVQPAGRPAAGESDSLSSEVGGSQVRNSVGALNRSFRQGWAESGTSAAPAASDLAILRRLSLALCGTIPSLEEIRTFESDGSPDRLDRWTVRLFADSRFADYFAERLARSFVGTEQGQFIVFRRDRFVDWLRQQIANDTPYDEIVGQMIAQTGLWTDKPATNFVTAAIADQVLDQNKLAGRTARAFLGQRIDCAQCHDHPFAEWKQAQFAGLAASFGQTQTSLVGVEDKAHMEFEVEDRKTLKKRVVEPAVPFHSEWLPSTGTRRARLAAWVTHPQNRRFERAAVNRIWGLLLGRPFHAPVDDLPDPSDGDPDVLDLLGADFREHRCNLKRLIRVIAGSQVFRFDSIDEGPAPSEHSADRESAWAIFPMTRLRPEQLIGSILQATSVRTIDQNSHLFVRTLRFFQENEFVKQYGDLGENELDERAGTISQALLRMNGKLAADAIEPGPLNATARIAKFAGNDERCVETCYLVALTRRPTPAELDCFMPQLAASTKETRSQVVEDLFWSLFNSPEFSWSH